MMADTLRQHLQQPESAAPLGSHAFLCLGGNIGKRAATLRQALELLELAGVRIKARSSLYETPPWGPIAQDSYLNQVVEVETSLSPRSLLELALRVERTLGRDRAREVRYGPRLIDIDILLFDSHDFRHADLQLPHPRILERAFVLVPLTEIAPDITIAGIRAADALARLDASKIRAVTPEGLDPL